MTAALSINFGANGYFFWASGIDYTVLGINLFAVIALLCLLRSNRSLNPTSLNSQG